MSSISDHSRELDRLDLAEVQRFLARRWRLVIATALACAVLAGIACLVMTPVYTATSQILLDPRKQHIFGTDTGAQDSALDSSIVDSQVSIITSTRLLAKVIRKEDLAEDPEFAASAKTGLLERLSNLVRGVKLKKAEVPSLDGIDPKLAPVIVHFFKEIDVVRVAKSYVLSISVSSRDAAKATRLANSLASTYVEDQIDVHAKSVQQAASFFEERLGRLREQVRQSESAVAAFRQKNNLTTTNMAQGTITVSEQQLQDMNQQLAVTSTDTAEKLARYEQAARFGVNGANLDTLPEIIRSTTISQLRTQQADLMRREADLSAMYGPAYPAITQIRAQRTGYDRAIAGEIRRLVTTLHNDYEVAKAREDAMRATVNRLSGVTGGDNETGVKLRELERTNMANKALFENFLNRAKLTQEASAFEEPDARLISPALEPSSPASPKTKLIVPVAGVAGLILGLGLAAGLDLRRRRSVLENAPRSGRADADAFILARVPSARGGDTAAELKARPDAAFAQAVAVLADKLATPTKAGRGRAVVLSPLDVGEGATSLALAVATVLGRKGRRVLLIDAGGGLSARLNLAGQPGLSDVLDGTLKATAAVIEQPHYAMLPSGRDFAAMRSAKPLGAFLDQSRARFDLVLLDAPAFAAGVEAPLALAGAGDGLALVASWDGVMRHNFVGAIDALAKRPDFLGLILNRTAADQDELAMAS